MWIPPTTVDISWIDPQTGSSVSIAESVNVGDTLVLDTYVNHTFIVQTTPVNEASSDDSSPAKSFVTHNESVR